MAYTQNIPPQIVDAANWCTQNVLNRTDIQAQANQHAVDFYTVLCATIPFDQLQIVTGQVIPFVEGQQVYNLATILSGLSLPPLNGIMSIQAQLGTNILRRLRRTSTRVYDALSFITNSLPSTYARFGTTIQVNPPPDSDSYTFQVRYWSQPILNNPNPETTVVLYPIEWLELHKYETLYRLYNQELDMPDKAAALVTQPLFTRGQPTSKKLQMTETGIIPRLWNDLLTTTSQKENVDEDFSINPVIRAYTYRGTR